jgi:hypothetical protein
MTFGFGLDRIADRSAIQPSNIEVMFVFWVRKVIGESAALGR